MSESRPNIQSFAILIDVFVGIKMKKSIYPRKINVDGGERNTTLRFENVIMPS